MAAVGFFLLAFFLSFANTGFLTFYQNNIPVDMMGRVSSVFGMFLAILQIVATLTIGFTGDLLSVRMVVVFGSLSMFILALILFLITLLPSKGKYYRNIQEQSITEESFLYCSLLNEYGFYRHLSEYIKGGLRGVTINLCFLGFVDLYFRSSTNIYTEMGSFVMELPIFY
jgi:hypothetical protein